MPRPPMHESFTFGLLVLCVGGAGLVAVRSHGPDPVVRIPAPALFLVIAAFVARIPGVPDPRT